MRQEFYYSQVLPPYRFNLDEWRERMIIECYAAAVRAGFYPVARPVVEVDECEPRALAFTYPWRRITVRVECER